MRNFSTSAGSPASIQRVTDSTDARGPGAGARAVVVVVDVVGTWDGALTDGVVDEIGEPCCVCATQPVTRKIRHNTLQTRTQ